MTKISSEQRDFLIEKLIDKQLATMSLEMLQDYFRADQLTVFDEMPDEDLLIESEEILSK